MYSIESLFCFGTRIRKKELIEEYERKLINFHPSLLPSFKVLRAIDQSLKSGVSFLGNTAHYIDQGIDTGDIILQTAMWAENFDDYEDVLELQYPMMRMILRDIVNLELTEREWFNESCHLSIAYSTTQNCVI